MKPGPVKSLVGVDVSDPGNPRLVEQKRLERSPPPLGYRAQGLRREPVGEGIDPEPGFEEAFELAIAQEQPLAEAPRIGEEQPRAVVELQIGSQIRRVLVAFGQHQVPGHPQVHDECRTILEPEHQVFPPALDGLDPPPGSLLNATRRLRATPTAVEDPQSIDRPAGDRRLELATDRLDLGKLGHSPIVTGEAPAAALSAGGPGVSLEVDVLYSLRRQVCVELGRRDVRVSQHLLDRPKVTAPREQMGGE